MSTSGRKLLSSVIQSGDMKGFIKLGLSARLFKDSENLLYSFIRDHVNKFGKLPSPETIEEHVGDALVTTTEPAEFYLEQVEKRYLQGEIKGMVIAVQDLLKDDCPDKAFEILINGVSEMHQHRAKDNLLDFREIAETLHAEYTKTKAMGDEYGLLFGWPTLDEMTGGLRPGDLCSFVGRPASGKTFMGLYTAHKAWESHRVPMFVSMEMTNVLIGQRLAAMHTHKNLTQLMKGMLSTTAFNSMLDTLDELHTKEQAFWLIDGNLTATVDDIILMARQLKPDSIWVDGAYLLRHPNPKASRWDKITENAEWLKQKVATDLGIPVVASYQFSREASKKKGKKGEKAGLEDIYGTDAIGQLSTVVMGLFEEDSIETQKQRKVEILKGRNGETGSFNIHWDFHGMDFSEVLVEDPKELQFL